MPNFYIFQYEPCLKIAIELAFPEIRDEIVVENYQTPIAW